MVFVFCCITYKIITLRITSFSTYVKSYKLFNIQKDINS